LGIFRDTAGLDEFVSDAWLTYSSYMTIGIIVLCLLIFIMAYGSTQILLAISGFVVLVLASVLTYFGLNISSEAGIISQEFRCAPVYPNMPRDWMEDVVCKADITPAEIP
jgi:hypothetical protein